jgi:nitroimidazol reductase NimA-like FMN-containing flavoprotein (pyridoxamine 5'-phosphate oxidase superfamily)
MREMTEKEIRDFIVEWKWGTILAAEDNKPYAVEVSYASDDNYLYCGSRPGGRMAKSIKSNPNAAFKICDSDPEHKKWRAIIVEGVAERMTAKEDVLYFVRLLAKKMGRPENAFDGFAEKIASNPEESNSIRIPLKVMSGVTNWP